MLALFIPSPSQGVWHLGPLPIRAYALCIIAGVVAAVLIGQKRWEARGGKPGEMSDIAIWAVPCGLVGARVYSLCTDPNRYFGSGHVWWEPFAVWHGGLGIWGGIAGGVLGGLYILYKRLPRQDVYRFMNAATPGLLVAQAFGRIGNYFNQELFGKPSTLPWALKIDPAHRPPGYTQYATFQPTFLYEIIWNLSLAAFLVWLGHHRKIKPPGLFPLYVAGYSAFRMFEEQLRIDYSNHILGMRLNFWIALALCLAGLLWFARIQWGWPLRSRRDLAVERR
jgi:prolipoprotein diacylglyceryl transferase